MPQIPTYRAPTLAPLPPAGLNAVVPISPEPQTNGTPTIAPPAAQPKIKANSAFNLTQAFKTLFKAPGDVLYGLFKYNNNLAAPQFANNPWQNPNAWYNRLINLTVPDHLEPPQNTTPQVHDQLQYNGGLLNAINGLTKTIIYWQSFRANQATLKLNETETIDPRLKRIKSLKINGDRGENLGMLLEKSTYVPSFYFIMSGQYGAAAALRAFGLVTSGAAWASSLMGGAAMIVDEAYAFRTARAEAVASGNSSPNAEAWKKVNVTNLQNAVSRITGGITNLPKQAITLTTGAAIYARAFHPDWFQTGLQKFAQVFPNAAESLTALLPTSESVDTHLIYSWLQGANAVPHDWITFFAAASMIAPAIAMVPNLGNMTLGIKTRLFAKRLGETPEAQHLNAAGKDIMTQSSLGIASSAFYLGAAYLMASPQSDAHGVLLSVFGSLFMTAQYLRGERAQLKVFKEQLVTKVKHMMVGWKLRALVNKNDPKND